MSAKENTKLLLQSLRNNLPQRPDRTRALGRQWLLDQLSPRDAARCVAWVHSQHIRYPQVFSLSSLVWLAYLNHTEWWAYNSVFIHSYSAPHLPMFPPTPANPFLFQSPPSIFCLLPFIYVLLSFSFFLSTALLQQLSTEPSGRPGVSSPSSPVKKCCWRRSWAGPVSAGSRGTRVQRGRLSSLEDQLYPLHPVLLLFRSASSFVIFPEPRRRRYRGPI